MGRAAWVSACAIGAALISVSPIAGAAQTAAERRTELAAIQEQINDPDPLMRLAYLEEIVAGGDPLKVELAIRTAMSLDDPQMRALAMRAYVTAVGQITFDWLYPEQIQKEIDRANGDEKRLAETRRKNREIIYYYDTYSRKVTFLFQDFGLSNSKFQVFSLAGSAEPNTNLGGEGRVVGDRLQFRIPVYHTSIPCSVELAPTASLDLVGQMNCNGWPDPMPIRARMF
jgi:hypothetical protein